MASNSRRLRSHTRLLESLSTTSPSTLSGLSNTVDQSTPTSELSKLSQLTLDSLRGVFASAFPTLPLKPTRDPTRPYLSEMFDFW
jgi:hypothetical protein